MVISYQFTAWSTEVLFNFLTSLAVRNECQLLKQQTPMHPPPSFITDNEVIVFRCNKHII